MDFTKLSSDLKIKSDFNANSTLGLNSINSVIGIVDNSVTDIKALIFGNSNPEYDDADPTNYDVTGITSGSKCFVFDVKKEYKYTLSSDITDHYTEDNSAIQDHIALKPIMLEVSGLIGEVDLKTQYTKLPNERNKKQDKKRNILNLIDSYSKRMGSLTSFAPNLFNQARNIYNTTKAGYALVNKLINTVVTDKTQENKKRTGDQSEYTAEKIKQTNQFKEITWFTNMWKQRRPFSIVTPYGILDNMYIMELNASQPESTRYYTQLNIKFKRIETATVKTNKLQPSKPLKTQENKLKEHVALTRYLDEGNILVDNTEDIGFMLPNNESLQVLNVNNQAIEDRVSLKNLLNSNDAIDVNKVQDNIKMLIKGQQSQIDGAKIIIRQQ